MLTATMKAIPTRLHVHEGAIYLIRDIWRETNGQPVCQCQYATRKGTSYVDLSWTDCEEGVSFADIEPVARVADLTNEMAQAA